MNQPLRARAKIAVIPDSGTSSDPYNIAPRLPQPRAVPALARPDSLDLSQLWSTLRQQYKFVLGVAIATFAIVMAATLGAHMKFRSVGRLYLGELEERAPSAAARANEIAISASNQGVIGSEVEIIQSRSLVARAILDSGLNTDIIAVGHPPPRYGAWLLSRRNPALVDVAAGELRATDSTLTDAYGKERSYSVRFVSDTQYEVWSDEQRLGAGQLGEAVQLPGASLTLAAGSDHGPAPGAQYQVTILPLQEVTDATLSALQISAPKPLPPAQPVNVVTLEFTDRSPRIAARFLTSLMAAYLNERQSWKAEDARAAEAFVTDQLKKTRESLDGLESKLAEYRSRNRVVVNDNQAKAMIEQVGKYEEQRVAARLEVAELGALQKALASPNPAVGALLLGGTTDTVIERMASSLAEARQRLTDLGTRFNDAAPDVRAQHEQVDTQLQSIRNYVASRGQRARDNLGTLDSIIRQFEGKLNTLPGAEVGLAQLARESEVYERMYTFLLERQQQTSIIMASTLSKNRVLDAPEISFRADSPKLLLRLASGPLGLVLGVFLVLVRSLFAGTLQSEAEVKGALGGLPSFASLPHLKRMPAVASSLDVLKHCAGSSLAEAFRTLRANLYRWGGSGTGKVLLVSSPNDGDGKTLCTLSLGAMLAADGKRVLVVDADLRKANQPVLGGDEAMQLGLRDVLSGECSWAEASQLVRLSSGEFYAIGAGGTGPAELLSSARMSEFLNAARSHCDYVLLDAPSFPAASDALSLSMSVDAVISVIRLGHSSRKLTVEHVRGLGGVAPAHAIVINGVGLSEPAKPRSRTTARLSAPSLNRWRWRALYWASALIVLTGGALAVLSRTSLADLAARTVTDLKR